jgi:hypothetical protein
MITGQYGVFILVHLQRIIYNFFIFDSLKFFVNR